MIPSTQSLSRASRRARDVSGTGTRVKLLDGTKSLTTIMYQLKVLGPGKFFINLPNSASALPDYSAIAIVIGGCFTGEAKFRCKAKLGTYSRNARSSEALFNKELLADFKNELFDFCVSHWGKS